LNIVENPRFIQILNAFIDIGRKQPQVQIGSDGYKFNRIRTRQYILDLSSQMHNSMLARFSDMPCVSLAIDAGTIERRHFLDIMILAPYSKIKPFLYAAIEQPTLTAEDYGSIVTEAIKDLFQKGVHVRSIVGDNLPAQVCSLAHWSSRSYLKRGEEWYLHGIKYSPCMCHFVQLVVGDFITRGYLYPIEELLQEMIAVVNHSEIIYITNSRCPQLVKTRWLSRDKALSWLISREQLFFQPNFQFSSKTLQRQFQKIFTRDNFVLLATCHRIIYPLTRAVKFFEDDHITLCHIYPALKTIKNYFREEAHSHSDSDPKYAECCEIILSIIQQRQRKLLDQDLVKAAFWLTSFGCQSLADGKIFIPDPRKLDIKYHTPHPILLSQGPPNRFRIHLPSTYSQDHQEEEEADYKYTGHEIREEELEDVPKIDENKTQVLAFLIKFLSNLMREDLDREIAGAVFSEIPHQVEESLQFFLCNPQSIAKCRHTSGDIDKQVELWNWMKYKSEDRISDQFTQKVISILSIPASEASCERSFSRQKRIMDHLRTRSNPELLRARFLFESSKT
jgi:hypothetical protein